MTIEVLCCLDCRLIVAKIIANPKPLRFLKIGSIWNGLAGLQAYAKAYMYGTFSETH